MLNRPIQEQVAEDLAKAIEYIVVNSNTRITSDNFVVYKAIGTKMELQFDIPEDINKVRRIDVYNKGNRLLSTINTTFDSAINTRVRYTISVELK